MEWIIFGIYFCVLLIVIKRWSFFSSVLRFKTAAAIFTLKAICGLLIGYIYSKYYINGDTFAHIYDANIVYGLLRAHPLVYLQFVTGVEIDTTAMNELYQQLTTSDAGVFNKLIKDPLINSRLNAFLCLFSFGYYKVHVLILCFLSFIGLTALYRSAGKIKENYWLISAVFFIPSVMFWGSGLLKEPYVLIFLCGLFYFYNKWITTSQHLQLIPFLVCCLLLFGMKPYILVLMLPGLTAWYLCAKRLFRIFPLFVCSYSLAFLFAVIAADTNIINIFQFLHDQQIIFLKSAVYTGSKSLIDLIPFAPNPVSVLKRSPEALWIALARPYPWEAKNLLQAFAAAENIFILLFILMILFKIYKKKISLSPAAVTAIISGILILIVTAFTVPVLGTLVRLKMPGLLLLLFGLTASIQFNPKNT